MTETPAPPRPPKPPKKKRRWLRRTLWTIFALGLLGVVGLVVAYVVTPIPKANERALQQNSIIYYADGKTVLDRFSTVNRQNVSLDRVPEQVQKAFLAAEDRTFYTNSGISPKGIARSVWVGLKGGPQQGGSTITQQYVKNYYLTQDRTLTRKAKEIMISIKIDGEVPKDQILEDYLNTIYFGRGADGIQTAAQAYFGQGVQNLDVAQGALLAAIIRGPSFYDPQLGPEQKTLAEGRWNYVLDGMVAQGWLSAGERAKLTFPETRPISKSSGLTGPNGFVSEAIREELKTKLKLTDTDLALGGLLLLHLRRDAAQVIAQALHDLAAQRGFGRLDRVPQLRLRLRLKLKMKPPEHPLPGRAVIILDKFLHDPLFEKNVPAVAFKEETPRVRINLRVNDHNTVYFRANKIHRALLRG